MSHGVATLTQVPPGPDVRTGFTHPWGGKKFDMTSRRFTMTALALVATVGLAVSGCAESADNASSTKANGGASTPQLTAAEELQAAVRKLNDDTVRVTLDGAMQSGGGVMDPRAGTAEMSLKMGFGGQSVDMEFIRVQNDIYLKMGGFGGSTDKWMHIDGSKISADSNLGNMLQGDPAGAENLMKGIAEVERDGERRFKGTIDTTKSPTANEESLKMLGDKAKTVPFTAAIDEQGRLIEFTLDMSVLVDSLGKVKATYSDFGAPVSVQPPAASEIMETPSELLGILNA